MFIEGSAPGVVILTKIIVGEEKSNSFSLRFTPPTTISKRVVTKSCTKLYFPGATSTVELRLILRGSPDTIKGVIIFVITLRKRLD